ncbi:hypothetical protein VP277E431_P0139 [Vibrio phage 277E43-1]|nr:hypothetical protein VP277E431_P0139 [Vibrio phage 277E43-1]
MAFLAVFDNMYLFQRNKQTKVIYYGTLYR